MHSAIGSSLPELAVGAFSVPALIVLRVVPVPSFLAFLMLCCWSLGLLCSCGGCSEVGGAWCPSGGSAALRSFPS